MKEEGLVKLHTSTVYGVWPTYINKPMYFNGTIMVMHPTPLSELTQLAVQGVPAHWVSDTNVVIAVEHKDLSHMKDCLVIFVRVITPY